MPNPRQLERRQAPADGVSDPQAPDYGRWWAEMLKDARPDLVEKWKRDGSLYRMVNEVRMSTLRQHNLVYRQVIEGEQPTTHPKPEQQRARASRIATEFSEENLLYLIPKDGEKE